MADNKFSETVAKLKCRGSTAAKQNAFMKKLRADSIQGIHAVFQFG
jgi:hypothetical protein